MIPFVAFLLVASQVSAQDCSQLVYRGFDSRLAPKAVARVPLNKRMTAFEAYKGKLLFGFGSDFLVANSTGDSDDADMVSISTGAPIRNLMVDSSGRTWLDDGKAVRSLGPAGLRNEPAITGLSRTAWISNSGSSAFLAVAQKDGMTRLGVVSLNGEYLPIGHFPGPLIAVSWNSEGLAAIIGVSLVMWPRGSHQLVRLLADQALGEAQDVCLIPNGRVVVSLRDVTVLLSETSRLVVAGFSSRPRFSDGRLYLADSASNVVWEVAVPDGVGTREADDAHARELLARTDPLSVPKNNGFLEAARILGCKKALGIVGR